MAATLPRSVASRVRELDDLKLKNQVRREMRSMLLSHLDVYARQHRELAAYYGENLPYSTGPESAARALYRYGVDVGILTEHNRPDFVRKWGGQHEENPA